ncbi:AI-2E family transporter [Natrarchaeobaculum aegyptiacum]|uniref:AI-2E family transporter n=1 Tax=Natrarchaeobaculum aegyptiacum TaxID=745377 RepID=A0A2Z2HRC2_9EURY|nr:AI-2E family transporter [Natrarchaeobaculum aegyptiacum]ARS89700.1 AI-2E family transporter [Natrarchaeobaculum aegyptiacum]
MTTTGDTRNPDRTRRYVLAGIVVALGAITAAILLEVLGTILFALTVAYVLIPVHGWFVRRGLSEWFAAAAATLIGFAGAVAVFAPIVYTLVVRVDQVIAILESLPPEIPVTAFEYTYTIDAAEAQALAIDVLMDVTVAIATQLPVLGIKFALFAILLFGLLLKGDAAGKAAVAPVPPAYRDVVYALAGRARETLYAIYVLQLATSMATFVIGYPLFWALGYEIPFTMAVIAAILQFVPIIGPSLLIVPVAAYHVAAGELLAAALVGVFGIALVAWLPDIAVRPRLARRSAGLPGSLYFVGFTGGLFTLGPIGIVVGPLIVAVFVEAVDLLADEVNLETSFTELVEDELEAVDDETDEPAGPVEFDADSDDDGDDSESPADAATATVTTYDDSAPDSSVASDADPADAGGENDR